MIRHLKYQLKFNCYGSRNDQASIFSEDNDHKPSVGQYDFIIVDEAHRGYAEDKELSDKEYQFYSQEDYVSQYRRVVDYFDATVIE